MKKTNILKIFLIFTLFIQSYALSSPVNSCDRQELKELLADMKLDTYLEKNKQLTKAVLDRYGESFHKKLKFEHRFLFDSPDDIFDLKTLEYIAHLIKNSDSKYSQHWLFPLKIEEDDEESIFYVFESLISEFPVKFNRIVPIFVDSESQRLIYKKDQKQEVHNRFFY